VFTDIKMPGIDGFEVLQRIKDISPGAVVIVITGHGDKELAKKGTDLKCNGFHSQTGSERSPGCGA
jgi:YesN/AraC family two-component response regulator